MIDAPEPNPERERLQAIIACCKKRMNRADEKARAALIEQTEAHAAHDAALLAEARWQEANPDPQGSLLEGISHV